PRIVGGGARRRESLRGGCGCGFAGARPPIRRPNSPQAPLSPAGETRGPGLLPTSPCTRLSGRNWAISGRASSHARFVIGVAAVLEPSWGASANAQRPRPAQNAPLGEAHGSRRAGAV